MSTHKPFERQNVCLRPRTLLRSLVLSLFLIIFSGCSASPQQTEKTVQAYEVSWFQYFDTLIQVTAYADSEAEFQTLARVIETETSIWNRLLDNYHAYSGVNNIYTLNQKAGTTAVEVDQRIIDILQFGQDMHSKTLGKTNIAMGSLTQLWQTYRDDARSREDMQGELPAEEELQKASSHVDLSQLIIDDDKNLVRFKDPLLKLDLGSIAKGYVTESLKQLLLSKGYDNILLNWGGNLQTIGAKEDGTPWRLGVKNPFENPNAADQELIKVILASKQSVVTSGNYERFYWVGEQKLHHIIDPDTAYPSELYAQVTIISENSAWGDALSTALFSLPLDDAEAVLKAFPQTAACWVLPNGSIVTSSAWAALAKEG